MLRKLIYIAFNIILFVLSIASYSILSYPAIFASRFLYYYAIFINQDIFKILIAGLFMLLESFVFLSYSCLDLLIILPICLFAYWFTRNYKCSNILLYFFVLSANLVHYIFLEHTMFGLPLVYQLNLQILLIYFTLLVLLNKIFIGGSGNRSRYITN